jgi:hypothetical protein
MVFSIRIGKLLRRDFDKDGYIIMKLRLSTNKNKQNSFRVHRLVALVYLGYEPDMQVNHKDGRVYNNDISNLEYVTQAGNTQHAYATGLIQNQYFNIDTVKFICRLLSNYVSLDSISKIVLDDITTESKNHLFSNVYHLIKHESWREYSMIINTDNYWKLCHDLSNNEIIKFRKKYIEITAHHNNIYSSTTIESVA